jgi:hypothetical protein
MANKVDTSHITLAAAYPPSKKGLDFQQDALQDTVAMAMGGLLNFKFVDNIPYAIFGCRKTANGSNFDYSEGVFFYNGELYFSEAVVNLNVTLTDICTITIAADPTADPTQMKGGGNINVHDIRTVVISNAAAVTNGDVVFNFDSIVLVKDTWHEVGTAGEPAFENSHANSGSEPLSFKIVSDNYVQFSGTTFGTNNTTVFTLPAGYRPLVERQFILAGTQDPVQNSIVTIATDGSVEFFTTSGIGIINWSSLRFPID